jgi:hypothetical protein
MICAGVGSNHLPRRLQGHSPREYAQSRGQTPDCLCDRAGLGAKLVDRLVVSTDDAEIAQIASDFGVDVPFLRPVALASDTALQIDVILPALVTLASSGAEFDVVEIL